MFKKKPAGESEAALGSAPEVHLAHSLRPDAILSLITTLLKYSPTTGGPSQDGNKNDYTPLPKIEAPDPLKERRERMVAALNGIDPALVCSNHVEHYPQLEAAVDVLAEAWGGGVPPYLYK